jgi:hypothetical protein
MVLMGFSESLKLEVKRKAAFSCCRCSQIGIDVHHIIPEKDGGKDDFDNAAPLCQNCHDQFGDNPAKRKEIRQMRDWWYEVCEKRFSIPEISSALEKINAKLEDIQKGQTDISELKSILKELTTNAKKTADNMIDNMSLITARTTASGIAITSGEVYASATQLGPGTYSNFHCKNCNTHIGLLIGSDVCPHCKAKIR